MHLLSHKSFNQKTICNRLETEEPAAFFFFCADFCAVLLCRFKARMGEIPEPRRQTCINQRDDISQFAGAVERGDSRCLAIFRHVGCLEPLLVLPANKASVWKRLCLILASCYLHGTWNGDSGGEYKPLRTGRISVTLCAFCVGAETCLTLIFYEVRRGVLSGIRIRNCLSQERRAVLDLIHFFFI